MLHRLENLTYDSLRVLEIGQSIVYSVATKAAYERAPQTKYEFIQSCWKRYGIMKEISLTREIVVGKDGRVDEYRIILHRDK